MTYRFNTPPGWPTPPPGWQPRADWQPDPTWPPAPQGWQLWIPDDAAHLPQVSTPVQQATGAQPEYLCYASAPAPGSGGQWGQNTHPFASQPSAHPDSPGEAGTASRSSRTVLYVLIAVGIAVFTGLLSLGIALLGGSEAEPAATAPASDPVTVEPSPEPSEEPTDQPDDPNATTPDPLTDSELLTPEQPAIVGSAEAPTVEVRLITVERNWQPENAYCGEPEGEYVALEFQFSTLPGLAQQVPPQFTVTGLELVAVDAAGAEDVGTSGLAGILCIDPEDAPPSAMEPNQTYTGWMLLDLPAGATGVMWQPFLDFTGEQRAYRWNLDDF